MCTSSFSQGKEDVFCCLPFSGKRFSHPRLCKRNETPFSYKTENPYLPVSFRKWKFSLFSIEFFFPRNPCGVEYCGSLAELRFCSFVAHEQSGVVSACYVALK